MSLIRGLSPAASISIVIGTVIGTGIFLKTRVMMCNVESAPLVITAWILAGFLSLAGALTYAELATMMPRAGGEYVFIRTGYGRMLAFLYGWTQVTVSYSGSQAAKGIVFAIFLNTLTGGMLEREFFSIDLFGQRLPFGLLQMVALAVIILATLVNCLAVSIGGRIAVWLTALKILIVIAIGAGAFLLAQGHWAHFGMRALGGACEGVAVSARGGMAGFGAAVLGALWAYDGWTNVAVVAGEVRNPQRNLPLALIGGILIVMVLYVFANLAYLYVLRPDQIANLPADASIATEMTRTYLGPAAVSFIAMAIMISTLGSLHGSTLAGARISYAMASDGLFFRPLARLGSCSHVPVNALVVQGVWSCVLALSGSFDTLTDYVIFAAWIFYGLNTASVFILRRRWPDTPRPYRTLGYPVVPVIFLGAAGWLTINTIIATPFQALAGLSIIILGLPVYWYWSRRSGKEEGAV